MANQEVAKIFRYIAIYLEMDNVAFKPQAYEKVASILEVLPEDLEDIYKKEGLAGFERIPGIGVGIAEKIEEYLKTGKIKEYGELKKKIPVNLDELLAVEGIGPKKIKALYQKLKIKNLEDLEKTAKAGKIRNLPNFGKKTEENILQGIEFQKRSRGRFLLGEILPGVHKIYDNLKGLKEVEEISLAGSLRRMKETIGDVDILVVSKNPKKVMDFFVSLPGVEKIWGNGATKSSIRMKEGFDVDVRVVPKKSYGSALQYFSGSKEHNIVLRRIAIERGFKLSEYGLFSAKGESAPGGSGPKMIAGENEEEIYKTLGLDWIPPEMRENQGEIEAALRQAQGKPNGLPKLIEQKDILGDLHIHSDWDGGENSIKEIAEFAVKIGYEYVGIADHTKFLVIENGLDEKQLIERNKEIDKINSQLKAKSSKLCVLKGCEANIMPDGSIDIKDEVLAQLDYVIAGVHSQLKMEKEEMTNRIIKAMKNPNVDIISHPTGRILKKRDEYEVDFDKLLEVAKETGTILEINAFPARLDLKDTNIKKTKEAGVKMIINTDAHQKEQMNLMEYGVAQARRGWAEKEDIVNTWPLEKMLRSFKK